MAEPTRRLIFGRRQGRPLKTKAREALDAVLPRLALSLDGLAAPASMFADVSGVALEIGFGGGEHLAAQARANPRIGFIGAEPFLNGVAKLSATVGDLANVRIHHGDARDVLDGLGDASVDRVYLLYPDPWPKPRHHKRRFVSAANLTAIARVMKPGAMLRIVSDIPDYVRWSLVEIARFNREAGRTFTWDAARPSDWRAAPDDWTGTRYEAKALEAGRIPSYLTFHKV